MLSVREVLLGVEHYRHLLLREANDPVRRAAPRVWNTDYLVLRRIASWLSSRVVVPGGTILDIGAGNSPYRGFITARHHFTLDASPTRFTSVAGDAHQLPFVHGTVDVITSFQVLEHLERPQLALHEMFRVLKPGGRLILTTHGIWPYHGHDYFRWTAEGLRLMLEEFRAVQIEPLGGPAAVAAMLLNHTVAELTRSLPRGPWRLIWRVIGAALIVCWNLSALQIERLLQRGCLYRGLAIGATDVYTVTAEKAATERVGGEARSLGTETLERNVLTRGKHVPTSP